MGFPSRVAGAGLLFASPSAPKGGLPPFLATGLPPYTASNYLSTHSPRISSQWGRALSPAPLCSSGLPFHEGPSSSFSHTVRCAPPNSQPQRTAPHDSLGDSCWGVNQSVRSFSCSCPLPGENWEGELGTNLCVTDGGAASNMPALRRAQT